MKELMRPEPQQIPQSRVEPLEPSPHPLAEDGVEPSPPAQHPIDQLMHPAPVPGVEGADGVIHGAIQQVPRPQLGKDPRGGLARGGDPDVGGESAGMVGSGHQEER
jgi:hypothetical protein